MHRSPRAALAVLLLVLVALAGCSSSDDRAGASTGTSAPSSGVVRIQDATVDVPALPTQAAVRFVVENGTGDDDVLIAASSPIAEHVTIHRSTVSSKGLSTMEPVARLKIPARSRVTFAPGGLHVMLTGLRHRLVAGQTFTLKLTFDKAGTRSAAVTVVKPGTAGSSEDMSNMDMEHDHEG